MVSFTPFKRYKGTVVTLTGIYVTLSHTWQKHYFPLIFLWENSVFEILEVCLTEWDLRSGVLISKKYVKKIKIHDNSFFGKKTLFFFNFGAKLGGGLKCIFIGSLVFIDIWVVWKPKIALVLKSVPKTPPDGEFEMYQLG